MWKKASLWAVCLLWTAGALWLSWQPGPETAETSLYVSDAVIDAVDGFGIRPDRETLDMRLRLAAHVVVFFFEGFFLAAASRLSLSRGWAFAAGALSGSAISVLAEVVKPMIPGRHLTWSETGLNVLGAICGAGLLCVFSALYARRAARRPAKT